MILASVSTRASDQMGAGHYYWTYQSLHAHQVRKGSSAGKTIGPKSLNAAHIDASMKPNLQKYEFNVSPWAFRNYALWSLRRAIEKAAAKGVTHVQFYDGGLMELLVCALVARRLPSVNFLYNFHWAEQWIDALSPRKFRLLPFRFLLNRVVNSAPNNLAFSAETKTFSVYLNNRLGVQTRPYPIFSDFGFSAQKKWADRQTDVLLLPQRPTEIQVTLKLKAILESQGLSLIVAVKPEVWEASGNKGNQGGVVFLPLPEGDFLQLIGEACVIVLPYDKPYFRWGSSGKFNEALCLGAFPFVPHWTAIASQSSEDPSLHHLDFSNLDTAASLIVARLKAGFPATLRGISTDDFLSWVETVSASGQNTATIKNHRVWLFALIGLSMVYRRVRLSPRLRKYFGGILDSQIATLSMVATSRKATRENSRLGKR